MDDYEEQLPHGEGVLLNGTQSKKRRAFNPLVVGAGAMSLLLSIGSSFEDIDDIFGVLGLLAAVGALAEHFRNRQSQAENPYRSDDSPEIAPK